MKSLICFLFALFGFAASCDVEHESAPPVEVMKGGGGNWPDDDKGNDNGDDADSSGGG